MRRKGQIWNIFMQVPYHLWKAEVSWESRTEFQGILRSIDRDVITNICKLLASACYISYLHVLNAFIFSQLFSCFLLISFFAGILVFFSRGLYLLLFSMALLYLIGFLS